ncbi:MAG: glutamate:proton symporter [Phycisphaerae bacterium]|nr:MAG: glutamate:proton symporter [Phycisphaerae bacterium]
MNKPLALHWKIIIGLVLGVFVGIALNLWWTDATWRSLGVGDKTAYLAGTDAAANAEAGPVAVSVRFAINATQFAGKLFIRSLRFIAVPIVLFSLIAGAASLGDVRQLGRIGGKTLGLFLITTIVSIVIGITLARSVAPGERVTPETKRQLIESRSAEAAAKAASGKASIAEKTGWDRVLETVPINPFESLAKAEMLQTVFLALVLGCCLTVIPRERSEPVVKACEGMAHAITVFVEFLMRTAPYAVFAIIVPIVATVGLDVLQALAVYALVVVAGLGVVLFGVYPLMLWTMTPRDNRVTFGRFFRAMAPAQLLAFSSSSSNATLPVNIECATERLGISKDVASFVLPLGATINMNGTGMYLSIVAVFLAQLYEIPLSLADQAAIVVTATLAAIGSAGIPGASIALMVIVLEAVHVPAEGIAIILGADRILDMCRTVVNTQGDAAVAAIVAGSEGKLGKASAG